MITTDLDKDPNVIRKYHPQNGLSYWSIINRTWVLDEHGQPVAVSRPDGPQRPVVREIILARKVQNWNAHETGSSVTLNTVDNITGCQP